MAGLVRTDELDIAATVASTRLKAHLPGLRALNDRGVGSPVGELTTSILDQIARYERLKIAERSRRGKLRKAREGKVVATNRTTASATTIRDGLTSVYENAANKAFLA